MTAARISTTLATTLPAGAPSTPLSRLTAILASRTLLFIFFQALIAGLLWLTDRTSTWADSAPWWPVVAALTNLVSIGILTWALRREGLPLTAAYHANVATWPRDLLLTVGVYAGAAMLVSLPSVFVSQWLFADPMTPVNQMFRPLPPWAAWLALIIFPLTVALAELPTYFGYAMPRLEARTGRRWLAVLLPAFYLALQHCALPLLFDGRFILWRLLMFLPLALYMALVLRWRMRLMPYLMVGHGLIDLQAALMLLGPG